MYDCTVRSLGQRDLLFFDVDSTVSVLWVLKRVMTVPTVLQQGPNLAL